MAAWRSSQPPLLVPWTLPIVSMPLVLRAKQMRSFAKVRDSSRREQQLETTVSCANWSSAWRKTQMTTQRISNSCPRTAAFMAVCNLPSERRVPKTPRVRFNGTGNLSRPWLTRSQVQRVPPIVHETPRPTPAAEQIVRLARLPFGVASQTIRGSQLQNLDSALLISLRWEISLPGKLICVRLIRRAARLPSRVAA